MSEERREALAVTFLFVVIMAVGAWTFIGEGNWLVASGFIVLAAMVVLFAVKKVFEL